MRFSHYTVLSDHLCIDARAPDVGHVVEVALDVPAQRLGHALAERGVRAAPVPECEAHDLALGEDGEHDAALHADGDDDHHDGAGELLGWHGGGEEGGKEGRLGVERGREGTGWN